MFGLGTQELFIILLIGAVLFGGKKLPELGKGIGEAIRGFKKGMVELDEKELPNKSPDKDNSNKGSEEKV